MYYPSSADQVAARQSEHWEWLVWKAVYLVVNADQELIAMVADTAAIRLVVPGEHDIAGGAEAAQKGPVGQAKHGALLICRPGNIGVVDGLVLH